MADDARPVGKPYEGHSGIARDSIWLTHEDLELAGKTEMTLTIDWVEHFDEVKFQQGRVRTNYLALHFVGAKRILGVNATIRKTLNKMFGEFAKGWKGQKVTLFITKAKNPEGGGQVKCIRVRETASASVKQAQERLAAPAKPSTLNVVLTPPDTTGSAVTPAPAQWPESWTEEQRTKVADGAEAMGVDNADLNAMIARAQGDHGMVTAALNRIADGGDA